MNLNIKNCNNIEEGTIVIEENKLNIKYGLNGTGKSTISKALKYYYESKERIQELKPFCYLDNPDINPVISIDGTISTVKIYNTEYISQYLFKESNEIMENSFEVFVAPIDYKERCHNIDLIVKDINDLINSSTVIKMLGDFSLSLSELINFSKGKTTLTPKSKIKTFFDNGNVVKHIPSDLHEFSSFILGSDPKKWADWHIKGTPFVTSNVCPYCGTIIDGRTEILNKIDTLFGKNTEIYSKVNSVLEKNAELFSNDTKTKMNEIINNNVDESEKIYFLSVYSKVVALFNLVSKNQEYTFNDLKKVDNVKDLLESRQIDIDVYKDILSDNVILEVERLNSKIQEAIKKSTELSKELGILKSKMKSNTRDNLSNINDFLTIAGIEYELVVSTDEEHILLSPKKYNINVQPDKVLSYGEMNAFALALFTCEVRKLNDVLIILDDPISSYDANKKFAILDYLFTGKKNLQHKTVLMLTHELEPIIHIYKVDGGRRIPEYVNAMFLENNKGYLTEKVINTEQINSIINVTREIVSNANLSILSRCIHLRKLLELDNKYEKAYNILSSLFKGKDRPSDLDGNKYDDSYIEEGTNEIKRYINGFDYQENVKLVSNKTKLKNEYLNATNNYVKLEIFRIYYHMYSTAKTFDNSVLKFINEIYHIENSYVFQLNPYMYNQVPQYIIDICDREINNI